MSVCALKGCHNSARAGGNGWCNTHRPWGWRATFPAASQWPLDGQVTIACGDCGAHLASPDLGHIDRFGHGLAVVRERLGAVYARVEHDCPKRPALVRPKDGPLEGRVEPTDPARIPPLPTPAGFAW